MNNAEERLRSLLCASKRNMRNIDDTKNSAGVSGKVEAVEVSTLKINFKDEDSVCIDKQSSLTFNELDCWVRQRFFISPGSHLAYYRRYIDQGIGQETYTEVIPNGTMDGIDELSIKIVKGKHLIKRETPDSPYWKYLVTWGPYFLLVVFAWALSPRILSIDIDNPDLLTQFLDLVGLSKKYRLFFIEGFIGFVCWSVTNLFIRRLLNPETHANALQRFAPDAMFGGLAAGVQSILKIILNRNIHGV